MANYRSRSSRERRIRARYRRKIWTCGIIMLILGLVLGYVLCMLFLEDKPGLFTKVTATPTPTPIVMVTEVPTTEPTAEPTPEPTAEPTPVPTEVPTQAPTAVPTAEPTEAPGIEPAIVFNSVDVTTAQPGSEGATSLTSAVEGMTIEATEAPTAEPTAEPTAVPTATPEPTAEPTAVPTATPEPTAEPTEEATAEPAAVAAAAVVPETPAEPTATPEPIIVPYGESCTFNTQIRTDGTAYRSAADGESETLNLTLSVDAYKDPAYFEANYADTYNLQGNEAAVEFDLTLNGYEGSAEIIPQNFLTITFCNEDESETTQGFQLMDTEIAGKTDIAITSGETSTLYKRYPYNADQGDMTYMVVTAYNDGAETTYWFEIQAPEEAAPTAETATESGSETASTGVSTSAPAQSEGTALTIGSKGDEVKKLQAKLIELGLLSGSPDGQFGKYTAGAVKIMQEKFGMEQTGIADAAFLEKLYGE